MKRIIGILGGMGPEATAYFYELIIKKTKAEKDQEHIKVIIYSNPEIPPRTDAILGEGPSPAPLLLEGVRRLMKAGADFIVIPCVTAHHFMPEVIAQDRFEFLSLLDESLRWTKEYLSGVKTVGLVSSTGTLKSRLFHEAFEKGGIQVIGPEEAEQDMVMAAIFGKEGIKAGFLEGRPKDTITDITKALIERGAEAIIAGCTEVPLVLKAEDISVPLIEPLSIMAEAAILRAGYVVKK